MVVQCPHCATETTLFEEDEAVVVAPVIMAEPDDDVPTVTPSAPPPPPVGGGKPPLPKPRPGMKKGGAPPPPRPRALKAPPPSNLKATSKPPPAPRVGLGLRRRPGALAVSRAGLDGRKAPSKVKALWEDEVEEVLKAGEKRCASCGYKALEKKFCPACGDILVWWVKALRYTGYIVVIALAVTAFMNYRRLYPPPVLGPDGLPPKGGVELLTHQMKKEKFGNLVYIRGMVTNHSPVDFFYVKVEFDLLDGLGQVIGTATDQNPVVASNAVWNYKAMILDPDARGYRNERISAVR